MIPAKLVVFYASLIYWIKNFKTLPAILTKFFTELFVKLKGTLLTIDYKAKYKETSALLQAHMRAQSAKGASKFKVLIAVPYIVVAQWLQGLSFGQSTLVISFTLASFIAGVSIFSTGNRLVGLQNMVTRTPASVEEEEKYDRPVYYKKDARHFLVSNIRIPVHFSEINELRTVDIDFNATLSNRQSRKFLEKYEFQLRDYLILNVEPSVASFPLEDEGREILKAKIRNEIDNFLKERQVEGFVEEIKMTYILAN